MRYSAEIPPRSRCSRKKAPSRPTQVALAVSTPRRWSLMMMMTGIEMTHQGEALVVPKPAMSIRENRMVWPFSIERLLMHLSHPRCLLKALLP